jgi:predicted membrane protein
MENKKSFVEILGENFVLIIDSISILFVVVLFYGDKMPFEDCVICLLLVLSGTIIHVINSARYYIIEEIKKSKDNENV